MTATATGRSATAATSPATPRSTPPREEATSDPDFATSSPAAPTVWPVGRGGRMYVAGCNGIRSIARREAPRHDSHGASDPEARLAGPDKKTLYLVGRGARVEDSDARAGISWAREVDTPSILPRSEARSILQDAVARQRLANDLIAWRDCYSTNRQRQAPNRQLLVHARKSCPHCAAGPRIDFSRRPWRIVTPVADPSSRCRNCLPDRNGLVRKLRM